MSCSGCVGCQSCHTNRFYRGSCSPCWSGDCPPSCRPQEGDDVVGPLWIPAILVVTLLYTLLLIGLARGLHRLHRHGSLFASPSSYLPSPLATRMLICGGCILLAEASAVAFVVFFHWCWWIFFWGRLFFYVAVYKSVTLNWCQVSVSYWLAIGSLLAAHYWLTTGAGGEFGGRIVSSHQSIIHETRNHSMVFTDRSLHLIVRFRHFDASRMHATHQILP